MEKERLQSGTAQWKKYKYRVSSQKDPGDEPLRSVCPLFYLIACINEGLNTSCVNV